MMDDSPEIEGIFNEDALRRLAGNIDDLIDDNGLQILVLSMRTELIQNQRENARRFSDLVNYLMQHYDDPETVYARLIYALQVLGHRRYGHRVIRKLEAALKCNKGRPFDIDYHIKVDRNTFLLHQYLAVACRVIPSDCCDDFIAYCSSDILEVNRGNYNTPCRVLTKMLEKEKISPENYLEVMEEALIKTGVPEHLLEKYQEMCQQIKTKSFHTRSRSSTHTSDGMHNVKRSHQLNVPHTFQDNNGLLRSPAARQSQNLEELSDSPCDKQHYCTLVCIGACLTLGLILGTLLALLGSHVSEINKTNRPLSLLCQENVSMIVTEINHLLTSSVTVIEDTKNVGDFERAVAVYRLASSCSRVPSQIEAYSIVNGTNLSLINGTTFYALSDSSIQFEICAATNTTAPYIERLDLLLQKNSVMAKVDFFHMGTGSEWQCKESKLDLQEPGYYTINFLPPTHEARFVFNATYNIRKIDAKQLQERASANTTLLKDEDSHNFPLTFGATYSCFVASIYDNPITSIENVHIEVMLKAQSSSYIIGGVLLPILLLTIIIITVVYVVLCCHKKTI